MASGPETFAKLRDRASPRFLPETPPLGGTAPGRGRAANLESSIETSDAPARAGRLYIRARPPRLLEKCDTINSSNGIRSRDRYCGTGDRDRRHVGNVLRRSERVAEHQAAIATHHHRAGASAIRPD